MPSDELFREVGKSVNLGNLAIYFSRLEIGAMKALSPKVVKQWRESYKIMKGRTQERSSSLSSLS